MKTTFERTLFLVVIMAAIAGFFLDSLLIPIILWIGSLIYLFGGWWLLNPIPGKIDSFMLVSGFIQSTALMAILFCYKDYPLKDIMSYMAITMLLIFSIVFLLEKSGTYKGKKAEPVIKAAILLILCILYLLF
jgi:hypothetical protein